MNSEEIQKLLDLSQISLTEEELATLQDDLESIINFVRAMQAIDTDDVKPLAHPLDLDQKLRDDDADDNFSCEALQNVAPEVEEGLYLVPKVIERS